MMTFKDLKKLVELPSYKGQRVPTVKALEVSGVPVVAEKILENHGSIEIRTRMETRVGIRPTIDAFGNVSMETYCHAQ